MIEEKEEIWIAEVVTAEMTEEVAAVKEEAAAVEIEEVVAVQGAAVVKAEEVADLVVVVEVAVAEEQAVVAEEEEINSESYELRPPEAERVVRIKIEGLIAIVNSPPRRTKLIAQS